MVETISGNGFLVTGPPTHSVGARLVMVAGICRRLSSSSVVCNTPRRNVTHKGAACGGPVVLRPVRATPCFIKIISRRRNSFSLGQLYRDDVNRPLIIIFGIVSDRILRANCDSCKNSHNTLTRFLQEFITCSTFILQVGFCTICMAGFECFVLWKLAILLMINRLLPHFLLLYFYAFATRQSEDIALSVSPSAAFFRPFVRPDRSCYHDIS